MLVEIQIQYVKSNKPNQIRRIKCHKK